LWGILHLKGRSRDREVREGDAKNAKKMFVARSFAEYRSG
jgi:hypothetical protein